MRSKMMRIPYQPMVKAPGSERLDWWGSARDVFSCCLEDMWRFKPSDEAVCEMERYLLAVFGKQSDRAISDKAPIITTGCMLLYITDRLDQIDGFMRFVVDEVLGGETEVMETTASTPLARFLDGLARHMPDGSDGRTDFCAGRSLGPHNFLTQAWNIVADKLPAPAGEWYAVRLGKALSVMHRLAGRGVTIGYERAIKAAMAAEPQDFLATSNTRALFLSDGIDPYQLVDGQRVPIHENNLSGQSTRYQCVFIRASRVEAIGELAASGHTTTRSLRPHGWQSFLCGLRGGDADIGIEQWPEYVNAWSLEDWWEPYGASEGFNFRTVPSKEFFTSVGGDDPARIAAWLHGKKEKLTPPAALVMARQRRRRGRSRP